MNSLKKLIKKNNLTDIWRELNPKQVNSHGEGKLIQK